MVLVETEKRWNFSFSGETRIGEVITEQPSRGQTCYGSGRRCRRGPENEEEKRKCSRDGTKPRGPATGGSRL